MSNRIRKNLYVKGSTNITQYNIDGKIVVIIGELHKFSGVYDKCPIPHKSVTDYISENIDKTGGSIILEIPPGYKYHQSGSINIDELLIKYPNNIIPIDIRPNYIDKVMLYDPNTANMGLKDFSIKFFNEMRNVIDDLNQKLQKSSLSHDQKNYLENHYLSKMFYERLDIENLIKANLYSDKNTIYVNTLNFWLKAVDFNIILTIFDSKQKYLYILVGDAHAKHIQDIFYENIIPKEKHKECLIKKSDNCANICGDVIL